MYSFLIANKALWVIYNLITKQKRKLDPNHPYKYKEPALKRDPLERL